MSVTTVDRDRRAGRELSDRWHRSASWLLTTDHKRIAILYLASITAFFFLGGAAAALIRLKLIVPDGLIVGRNLQPAVHHAWRGDGLVLPVPAVPVTLGNFSCR